jgi:putative CocE/NonD family hydrolase
MAQAVDCTKHLWISLPDGTRLAARLWRPVTDAPVPALIEYLPYRKSDGTAASDPVRHAWFAGQGYASLRIDLRGSGDSDGCLLDEYHPQELQDGVDAIAWVAAQPWCNGRVGLFGISWGGFNALQLAALRPPALRAIVSACSTDDRYADDVHYLGGCVQAIDALGWATQFTAIQCRAPLPAARPDDWRATWRARLEAMPHFAAMWLEHPLRDAYWRHGSVCEDYTAIAAPVLLVGGWADGYTNAIPRMLAGLAAPTAAVIGPWPHAWPDSARPGPRIDFHAECLAWWDRWLRDDDGASTTLPRVRLYEQASIAPGEAHRDRPGAWLAPAAWPDALATHAFALADDGLVAQPAGGTRANARLVAQADAAIGTTITDLAHGQCSGTWCPFGGRHDFPTDQRADDARSLCFDTTQSNEGLAFHGQPQLQLALRVDQPQAQLVARLCDVAPDGSSLLLTRGVLDLRHRQGSDAIAAIPVGEVFEVALPLDVIAHRVAPGHRLRLALATSYWPLVWPAPAPVRMEIMAGTLVLPSLVEGTPRWDAPAFDGRTDAPVAPMTQLRAPSLQFSRDVVDGELVQRRVLDGGEHRDADGWTVRTTSADTHRVRIGDAGSARVTCEREVTQGDDTARTRIRVTASMRREITREVDAGTFELTQRVEAWDGDQQVFTRDWYARV